MKPNVFSQAAFFFSLLCASALPASADSLTQDAINRGELLENSKPFARATVGLAIAMQVGDKVGAGVCTGTLIDQDIVLTAAHCLSSEGAKVLRVVAVVNSDAGRKAIEVESFRVHSQFTGSHVRTRATLWLIPQLVVLNDIAVIKLKEPVPAGALVATLPEADLPEGKSFDLIPVGYGKPDGTEASQAGTLRIGASLGRITTASNGTLQFLEFRTGAMVCQGDSGGPIFLKDAATPTVVGVTSHGDIGCESRSVATVVSHYLGWIRAAREELR